MNNKFTLPRVAIIVSAVAFSINAVTFASQHPFSWTAYLGAVLAVAFGAVGGFMIGRNQPEAAEPAQGAPK